MNKIQVIIFSINFILFSLVSANINDKYQGFLGAIILFSPLVFKIKAVLRTYQTKVFYFVVIVLLLLLTLYLYSVYIYSTDFYNILKLFFAVGILYFQLDAFAYLEYKKIYGSLASPSPVKPKAPIPTPTPPSSTASKTRKINCINCGNSNVYDSKNDICSHCGSSISLVKTSTDFFVECINCGEKNKNPTTDLCTKCGKSLSIKSSAVKCTNCGGEFDSKESNCPYCATQKV